MDRRRFVQSSFLGLSSLFLSASCSTVVSGPASYNEKKKNFIYLGLVSGKEKTILKRFDLETQESVDYVIPMSNPHSLVKTGNPDVVYIFEFNGSAVKLNLATHEVLKVDQRINGEGFFQGHAFYSPKDDLLWCTEEVKGQDILRARSPQDLRIIEGSSHTFPGGHHVVRLPDTSIVVSCGSGSDKKHYFSFIDIDQRKQVLLLPCEFPGIHIQPLSSTEVVAVTSEVIIGEQEVSKLQNRVNDAKKPMMTTKELNFAGVSPLIYGNLQGEVKNHWGGKDKKLLQLGVGIDRLKASDDRILTSHLSSGVVILWKNLEIEKVIPVPDPLVLMVTPDGKEFMVQSKGTLKVFSLETYQEVRTIKFDHPIYMLSKY